jgi:hypothetical protein
MIHAVFGRARLQSAPIRQVGVPHSNLDAPHGAFPKWEYQPCSLISLLDFVHPGQLILLITTLLIDNKIASNSFVWNILRISPLNSKILTVVSP